MLVEEVTQVIEVAELLDDSSIRELCENALTSRFDTMLVIQQGREGDPASSSEPESVLEFAEDLLIDIPQFWGYFGVMVATIILEKVLDVKFIQESSGILKSNNLDSQYVSAILCQMTKLNSCLTHELWSRSGFTLKVKKS